jgi:hypothetical protein
MHAMRTWATVAQQQAQEARIVGDKDTHTLTHKTPHNIHVQYSRLCTQRHRSSRDRTV